jgi:hypothetical protein
MYSNSFLTYEGGTDTEPDFVYYDITIASSRTEEIGIVDPPVRFSESRTQPILNDCSKYNMSIIRFTMDGAGSDLPLWIPQIMTDTQQSTITGYTNYDPNMTIYGITITHAGAIDAGKTVYLEWTTEVSNAFPNSSKYYYCYSYSHFCDIFNTAVASAVANVAGQVSDNTVKPPKLVYNGSTNLFSLISQSSNWGAGKDYTLFFDANLYQLLRNFNNVYIPNVAPMTNRIIINDYINNTITGDDGDKYLVITQDFPSTDTIWSPISSIVFTSSLLPIVAEQLGQPIIFSDGNVSTPSTSQANFQQTITDIALPLIRSSDYKGFVEYAPNPYRMISLSPAKQEIRQIDLSVFFKNRFGVLTPCTLANGASVSLKILFRKKNLLV